MPRILIITGEASGDLHGANLAIALKTLAPDATLLGIGGAHMQAAGVNVVEGIGHLDIIGLIGPSALRAVIHRLKKGPASVTNRTVGCRRADRQSGS